MSCRFYGKSHHGTEQHGNQCPLIEYAYAPCQMEIQGKAVDETVCQKAKKQIKLEKELRDFEEGKSL